jgi:hypothetical protein
VTAKASRQCGRTSDWMVHAGLMEKIMSKAHDPSKLDHAKLENRVLADSELDAVTGGRLLEAATKGKVFKHVEIHGTA